MDYSKLSDKEINILVGSIKGFANKIAAQNGLRDYCNNPADAWPIIVENEISLISRCANGEWKAQLHLGREDIFDSYASCWDKNPLRAAMIVFLMMQEAK